MRVTFEWVPGVVVGLATGFGSFFASTHTSLAVINEKMLTLKDGETLMSGELRAAAAELRTATSDIRAMSVEQAVINKVNAKALEGIVSKLEQHSETIASHSTAISMLSAQVTAWRAPKGA